MDRCAWKARILPGMAEEYVRRHDEIWPEMSALLDEAGMHNYTIFRAGDELFGYYEAEKGAEYAARVQAGSDVVRRWNESMKDVMVMEMDPETGVAVALTPVFYHA